MFMIGTRVYISLRLFASDFVEHIEVIYYMHSNVCNLLKLKNIIYSVEP